MAGHTQNALQKALYQTLASDSTLTSLVTGIYDAVPEHTSYPYVVFAGSSADNLDSLGSHRERIRLRLEVYSRTNGRRQTQTILDRVHVLLHHANPALDGGYQLHALECTDANVTVLADNLTWRGAVAVEAIVQ